MRRRTPIQSTSKMINPLAVLSLAGTVATETYDEFGLLQPDKSVAALERRYSTPRSKFVDVGDSRIHYAEEGAPENPTLLLIHGTYASLHTWNDWVDELVDEYHIVRLDMPGFGLTGPRRDGELTFEYLIETISEFADVLSLSDVTTVGNSLGGGIAWRLSVKRPDLVSRLVLVDAGGASLLARLAGNLSSLGNGLIPRYMTPRLVIRLVLRDAYGDPSKVTSELVRRYHDLLLRPGNRRSVIEIANNYAADYPIDEIDTVYDPHLFSLPSTYEPSPEVLDGYDIEDVSIPTLFQWGSEDEWISVSFGRNLAARVPNNQFLVYEGVGHIPMEESPADTAQDVKEFLSS